MLPEQRYQIHYTYGDSPRWCSPPGGPYTWDEANKEANLFYSADLLHYGSASSRLHVAIWPDGAGADLMQLRADLLHAFQRHAPHLWQRVANDLDRFPTFSADEPGQISFAQRPADRFNTSRRIRTTIGRYLSRRLSVKVDYKTQQAIELIARDGGYCPQRFHIESDVPMVYEKTERKGIHSCMNDNPDDCLDFYVRNGIKVLVFEDYKGRALLWNLGNGERFLDRIYPDDGNIKAHYKQYCHDNGIMMRRHNRLPCGSETDGPIVVAVDCNCPMPYMDTFGWASDDLTSLRSRSSRQHPIELHNTDGAEPEGDCHYCERCESGCSEEELTRVDGQYVCESCAEEAYYCESCHESTFGDGACLQSGEWYCESCLNEYAIFCDRCDSWHHENDATMIDDDPVCNDCAQDANRCGLCGELTFGDLESIEGGEYCPDCVASCAHTCSCGVKSMRPFEIRSPITGDAICADCSGDLMASM